MFAYDFFNFTDRFFLNIKESFIRNKQVKQGPQSVNISLDKNVIVIKLLGSRKIEAGNDVPVSGKVNMGFIHFRLERFADAKIHNFNLPLARHKNIIGLEISVNDQFRVCKLNGLAYLQKKGQPFFKTQFLFPAVGIYRITRNIFHDQVG
ncbi:MAG: hypothetical protein R6U28_08175 [Cyclonatronaceae bacterium]